MVHIDIARTCLVEMKTTHGSIIILRSCLGSLFKPAWLPSSAEIAFSDVNEQFRNARTPILASMANDQVGYVQQGSVSVIPTIVRPDFDIQHSMIGARMGFNLGGVDMSFSCVDEATFREQEEAVVTGNTIDVNVDLT